MDDLMQLFADDLYHIKKETLDNYQYRVNDFLQWLNANGVQNISSVTSRHIKRYFGLRKEVYTWHTLRNTKVALGVFFRWLTTNEFIDTDKFQEAEIKLPLRPKKSLPTASQEEVMSVMTTLQRQVRADDKDGSQYLAIRDLAIISLMWGVGLRRAEVRNLKCCHVDYEERLVYVINGKGGKDRRVPFQKGILKNLQAWRDVRKTLPLNEGYLFIGLKSARGRLYQTLGNNAFYNTCRKRAKQAGIENLKRFTPHALRRGYATQCALNGMDPKTLSLMMGHETPKVTLEYYINIDRERAIAQGRKFVPDF